MFGYIFAYDQFLMLILPTAQLLLQGGRRARQEAHSYFCPATYLTWGGAHLRLQVSV